jgi:hypothetical protein
MQLELFAKRYPEVASIKQFAHIGCGSAQLDGWYYPNELRLLADFLGKVEKDFYEWYKEVRKFDDQLEEEPVNVYWHDFCDGRSPIASYKLNGKTYGRKKSGPTDSP